MVTKQKQLKGIVLLCNVILDRAKASKTQNDWTQVRNPGL